MDTSVGILLHTIQHIPVCTLKMFNHSKFKLQIYSYISVQRDGTQRRWESKVNRHFCRSHKQILNERHLTVINIHGLSDINNSCEQFELVVHKIKPFAHFRGIRTLVRKLQSKFLFVYLFCFNLKKCMKLLGSYAVCFVL